MLQDEHRYDPPRSRRELAWLRQELRAIGRLVGAQ